MFNLFKPRKLPPFPSLSTSPHKSLYFLRVASWLQNKDGSIIVMDPHRPRVITMDPWPQLLFIAADGQMTVEECVHHMAKQYSGKVPEGLDETILNELQTLLNEKLIELSEIKKRPEPAFDQPSMSEK